MSPVAVDPRLIAEPEPYSEGLFRYIDVSYLPSRVALEKIAPRMRELRFWQNAIFVHPDLWHDGWWEESYSTAPRWA